MRDEGEVGEAALDAGLQDGAGPRVAQGSPVLGQQVCKLLTKLSAGEKTQQDVILGFPQNNNTTTTSVLFILAISKHGKCLVHCFPLLLSV